MKKILFVLNIIFFGILSMSSQEIVDNAIGVRIGSYGSFGGEVSYQKKIDNASRAELNLGFTGYTYYNSIRATALYQRVFDFTPLDNMNWYLGAGAGVTTWKYDNRYYYDYYDYNDSGAYFSVIGQGGVDYKFDFPLLVSFDIRSGLNFGKFDKGVFFSPGVSARYTF